MLIKPQVRGFICTTTHPLGCQKNVEKQIAFVEKQGKLKSNFKKVLIIGGSTGYGLASRIVLGMGGDAETLNIAFERPYKSNKAASPGWYQSIHYEKLAEEKGLYAKTIMGDAFSDEIKTEAIEEIKKSLGTVDLVIYSLAAPRRTTPSGEVFRSVLKTIGKEVKGRSLDTVAEKFIDVELPVASQQEIDDTVKVMGGEDWKAWIDVLKEAGVLSKDFYTMAYSYIGDTITEAIYRKGTIGKAKEHLEATAKQITEEHRDLNGQAYISVNKALVTQASSAIPIFPLYVVLLYKVMKEKSLHEGCIEQLVRLFYGKISGMDRGSLEVETDENHFIRLDDWEMSQEVQDEVKRRWDLVNEGNLDELGDLKGYQEEFLQLFGFKVDGIDYEKDVTEAEFQLDFKN